MTFTSALIVERTSQGSRASVKEQGKKKSRFSHLETVILVNLNYNLICFYTDWLAYKADGNLSAIQVN